MEANSVYQSMLAQTKQPEIKALQLKEGQIIHGKINKLFPNQMAEVQVGSNKVIAQLQTPLKVEDRHWFIVQSTESQLQLKVVPNVTKENTLSESAILRQLQIAPTKTNQELVQMLDKHDLPISKEIVSSASEWLKGSKDTTSSIEAIKILLQKNLPFTKDAFLAMQSLMEDESTIVQMKSIKEILQNSSSLTTKETQLLQLLNKMASTESEKMGNLLLQKLINEVTSTSPRSEISLSLLKNLQVIPNGLGKNEAIQFLGTHGSNKLLIERIGQLKDSFLANNRAEITNQLTKMNDLLMNSKMETNELTMNLQNLIAQSKSNDSISMLARNVDAFSQQFHAANQLNSSQILNLLGDKTGPIFTQLNHLLSGQFDDNLQLTQQQKIMVLQIVRDLQVEKFDLNNSTQLKTHLTDIFKSLGLNNEKMLVNALKQGDLELQQDNLKSLLLAVNNEATGSLKDGTERLISKLTGFQLLSQENNSLLQLNYQIPISFWDQTKDLTIQWSGKKNKNGEIDPDHCRVLFYLELENIGMTTVDVQVQNRVIHITIVNETDKLKVVAKPFMDSLRAGLESLGYTLSHLTFTKTLKEELINKTNNQPFSSILQPNEFSGVDYRI